MFGIFPALRSEVLSTGIEGLDINILYLRPKIRESPGDSLIVSDDHVRHAWQREADDV